MNWISLGNLRRGESSAVYEAVRILRLSGHQVERYGRVLHKLNGAIVTVDELKAAAGIKKRIRRVGPDRRLKWCPEEWRAEYTKLRGQFGRFEARAMIEAEIKRGRKP